ncbi:MAG: lipopolysaccharide biosynthesis protein [Hoeflea sp.]|uniref:lipopolysaccharide biosynthesis protein n=1 Tax=Hoeflea sp. TaxID=1940281 RepID=UPI002731F396|nr:lipopolysaccharide biosynthesis protein [Hoeflea sp.]MDP2121406.1 lipopolysaccharide biosynthesis protein [Hoeflea sp.]MDP3527519.1 lipopolysaccharide biosynthesis protein [Hoeflea sp.]
MIARLKDFTRDNGGSIRAYLSLVGGSAGRLVISLVYFIAIANTLSISEFGLFATASACGIMLSRLLAFGFVSPLYRIATVKTRLLGAYTAGFLGGMVLSAPVIALAAWATYALIFAGQMDGITFAKIILAEVLCWRLMEIAVIVSYGVNRFAAGAALVVIATTFKTVAAVLFSLLSDGSLEVWATYYILANDLAAIIAVAFFYPKIRLRWKPALYMRRWADAVSVAGAEMLFYVQSELDKVLVLSLGGPAAAGIYAMIMRLVDLTALPVRAFLTVLTQRLMRSSKMLDSLKTRFMMEGAVAAVSTAGILGMAGFLWIFPNALGRNVSEAAPLLILVALVPAFRNLIEYHSELLYATGRTFIRMLVLASLAVTKALLLAWVLGMAVDTPVWVTLLNAAFLVLYAQSALLTYRALRSVKGRAI